MIILGIDPGLAIVGYGAVTVAGGKVTPIGHGVINTPAGADTPYRLAEIYADMRTIIGNIKPDHVAVEKLFYTTNQKTVIDVAQARGVIMLALRQANIEIFEYTPLQVKMSVTGYGKADKKQMIEAMRRLLGMAAAPKPDDAADALAIALCHAHVAQASETRRRLGT